MFKDLKETRIKTPKVSMTTVGHNLATEQFFFQLKSVVEYSTENFNSVIVLFNSRVSI